MSSVASVYSKLGCTVHKALLCFSLLLFSAGVFAQPPITYPDNIDSNIDCFGMPPATALEIPPDVVNKNKLIHNYMPLLAGDIDGDGTVEIVGAMPKAENEYNYDCPGIRMFTYDGEKTIFKKDIPFLNHTVSTFGSMAMARYDGVGYIVVYATGPAANKSLHAYNAATGAHLWESEPTGWTVNNSFVNIADFNADGIPEVFVGNRIYSLKTGALLCEGGTYNSGKINAGINGNFTHAADVTGDGKLDLCAGTQVYEVTIPEGATTAGSGTMTVNITLTATLPATTTADGATITADIDNDGELEVVVTTIVSGRVSVYIWKPNPKGTPSLLGLYTLAEAGSSYHAIPMIGNIDDDTYPEILFITDDTPMNMYALKYNSAGTTGDKLALKWTLRHTDSSGCTGMSLFDFNIDGKNEIIYRDQTKLRVIDGSGTAATEVFIFTNVTSATLRELPIVADIDGDDQAEIIVTGYDAVSPVPVVDGITASSQCGYLRVFESGGAPWAYARPVWNQYAYNAVNVNEDLTIPAVQFNPATEFPGVNGNPVRPFNGFMTQQTMLSTDGTPFLPLPDMALAAPAAELSTSLQYTYYNAGDSLVLTAKVVNTGDAALNPPVAFAAYKDEILPENLVGDGLYSRQILQGDTATLYMRIENFIATHPDAKKVRIRLNDDGSNFPAQAICTGDATKMSATLDIMIAEADEATTLKNNPITISVLANDSLGTCLAPDTVIVITPSPDGTTTVSENGAITFTPATDYSGSTTFTYQVECNGKLASAVVTVNVLGEYPDNISDADCFVTPPGFEWAVKEEESVSVEGVRTTRPFVVGDLNEDGKPDIVAVNATDNGVVVFWGPDFTTKTNITTPTITSPAPLAIGKVKISEGVYKPLIFINNGTNVSAYDPANPSTHVWNTSGGLFGSVGLVDFNNDGWTEVYVGNRVFDAATGTLLCSGLGNRGATVGVTSSTALPLAIDIIGDSRAELVAGNQIFDVQIDRTAMTGTMSVIKTVAPPAGCPDDGFTVVADFDNDGKLEVLVRSRQETGQIDPIHLYLWSPHTETPSILASTSETNRYFGIPFVGDIDGDGIVEIVSLSANGLIETQPGFRARKYNKSTGVFDDLWNMNHIDQSGGTAMTLFDFNQDGKSEIVYRDEKLLRIIDGSTATPIVLNQFDSYSETFHEYPVVVDLFGDGHSRILVTSDSGTERAPSSTPFTQNAKIQILTSDGSTAWATARKVWNQYAYNAVNVNEDLTIPRNPINSATIFPGEDGVSGTSDDTQPFNNFLQQQTKVNQYGVSYWTLPDLQWNSQVEDPAVYHYHADGDSLTITAHISNPGDAMLEAPISFAVYKESVAAGNLLGVGICPTDVLPGDTAAFSLRIDNFMSQYASVENLVVRLNDDGVTFPALEVCSNTSLNIDLKTIFAANDQVSTLQNNAVTISVLANDSLGSCPEPKITVPVMTNGVATANDKGEIVFIPDTDYAGITTFTYQVECDGLFASAVVTVNVLGEYPDNISDADCFVDPPEFDFTIKRDWISPETDLHIESTPLAGDIDGDGVPEIVAAAGATGGAAASYAITHYHIYKGDTKAVSTIATTQGHTMGFNSHAMARMEINGDTIPVLVMVSVLDSKIYAYNLLEAVPGAATPAEATPVWVSDAPVLNNYNTGTVYSIHDHVNPTFADFDNDGTPELFVANRIFDATTGKLLIDGSADGTNKGLVQTMPTEGTRATQYFTVAANVLGDDRLELLAGNEVYSANIDKANPANSKMTLAASIPDVDMGVAGYTLKDGKTITADINQDGRLDVIYCSVQEPNFGIVAWDVQTQTIIAKGTFPTNDSSNGVGRQVSAVPFAGIIDEEGDMKIVIVTFNTLNGLKLNTATKTFDKVYELKVSDASGSTGITLFDFNQDGKGELVYRDQAKIRVLSAENGSFTDKLSPTYDTITGAASPTFNEYPIIVDADGDGSAEIITLGAATSPYGTIRIYKGNDGFAWAPARTVWNQYAYNAANVNEDLTIPKFQMNPATIFPGEDGILGNDDDVQPFNNFLQQQTTLSKWGTSLWLAPNGQITEEHLFVYDKTAETMTVTVKVVNVGEAAFQAPFHVTVYKNEVGNALKYTYPYNEAINPSDTASITFVIDNFSEAEGWFPHEALVLKINDKGDGLADQPVCDDVQTEHPFYNITNTPQDVCQGNAVPIECAFTLSDNDSYQWQQSNDSINWTDIDGENFRSYKPVDKRRGKTWYRVLVTPETPEAAVPAVVQAAPAVLYYRALATRTARSARAAAYSETVVSEPAIIRVRSCFMPVNPHTRVRIER